MKKQASQLILLCVFLKVRGIHVTKITFNHLYDGKFGKIVLYDKYWENIFMLDVLHYAVKRHICWAYSEINFHYFTKDYCYAFLKWGTRIYQTWLKSEVSLVDKTQRPLLLVLIIVTTVEFLNNFMVFPDIEKVMLVSNRSQEIPWYDKIYIANAIPTGGG